MLQGINHLRHAWGSQQNGMYCLNRAQFPVSSVEGLGRSGEPIIRARPLWEGSLASKGTGVPGLGSPLLVSAETPQRPSGGSRDRLGWRLWNLT